MKFVERSSLRAVVDQALPLAEARRAHELMQDRAVRQTLAHYIKASLSKWYCL